MQTDALWQASANLPDKIEWLDVPFFPQSAYQCGPAALATVLANNGINITPDELTPLVYLPERKGSVQPEMIAASRRYQHVPYVIQPRLQNLLQELAAGHPVLILQNLGLSWIPNWHYAVVVGYDLQQKEFILRSGTEQRHVVPMRVFERTWARANYWGMVVLPADKLPATAEEAKYLAAVMALEKTGGHEAAARAYQQASQRWPQSYTVWMGLGNRYYGNQAWQVAADAFNQAIAINPDAGDAWNNLADSLLQLNKVDEAYAAAQRALALGGVHREIYQQTLQQIEAIRRTK